MINEEKLNALRNTAHEAQRAGIGLYPQLSIPDARKAATMTMNAADLVALMEEVKAFRRVRMLSV